MPNDTVPVLREIDRIALERADSRLIRICQDLGSRFLDERLDPAIVSRLLWDCAWIEVRNLRILNRRSDPAFMAATDDLVNLYHAIATQARSWVWA